MTNFTAFYKYIESDGTRLFTVVTLPDSSGKFPVVVVRTPYVDIYEDEKEENIVDIYLKEFDEFLKHGYAVVIQHCRGTGKSDGDCIPYIYERKDGLNLYDWIRSQSFYNGELYLKGSSYLSSVLYLTAPFADDIKGAIFSVQDYNRYNVCYRNGFLKKGLHGSWYVRMYKKKSHMEKNYNEDSFEMLPLKDFTKTVFGEPSEDFDLLLEAPNPDDEFWNTSYGGIETKGVTDNLDFPALYTTSLYDIYCGGIFDMWKNMSQKSKEKCALLVSAYDHGDTFDAENSIEFPNGSRKQQFGEFYEVAWLDYIRGVGECPFETGKISYYNLFENTWKTDDFYNFTNTMKIKFGNKEVSYVYNPDDAPGFKGGLSRAFGGTVYQDKPNLRDDIITVYTDAFEKDVLVKGKMSARLNVKSDCEDTCFYVRISIPKEKGDYGLRDDINSLCFQLGDYTPGEYVNIDFSFDEHSFLIQKGERLRIDIASADREHYVRHTNQKGLYSEQTSVKIANNTVNLEESYLVLPIE